MVAHCDFVEQTSTRDDDGRLLRPDLVVRAPRRQERRRRREGAARARTSTRSSADDEDARRVHSHATRATCATTCTKLGQKAYWQQFEPAPEFVVMFLPDEAFFRAALEHDPSLLEAGVDARRARRLADDADRAAAHGRLRLAAGDGRRERARGRRLGRELYDRLGVFAGHFAKVGPRRSTRRSAPTTRRSARSRRACSSRARKFPEHGAATGELPPSGAARAGSRARSSARRADRAASAVQPQLRARRRGLSPRSAAARRCPRPASRSSLRRATADRAAVRERLVDREVEAVRRAARCAVPSSGQLTPSVVEPRPHCGQR